MTKPSSVIDFNDENANMYGCQPCPKCGSKYRCVFAATNTQIDCDDCGHVEQITERSRISIPLVVDILNHLCYNNPTIKKGGFPR